MQRVFGTGNDIQNLDRASFNHGAAGDRAAVHGQWIVLEEIDVLLGVAEGTLRTLQLVIRALTVRAIFDRRKIRQLELRLLQPLAVRMLRREP